MPRFNRTSPIQSSLSTFSKPAVPRGRSWGGGPTLIVLLILSAALPYSNTLLNSFVYDDHFQVLDNPQVRSFRYLPQMFTTSVWSFRPGRVSNYYRPMMTFGGRTLGMT